MSRPGGAVAVLDVLAHWLNEVGRDHMPDGAFALRNALIDDSGDPGY